MSDLLKLKLVELLPKGLLKLLWKTGIVKRTTVFRWEMNVGLREWK